MIDFDLCIEEGLLAPEDSQKRQFRDDPEKVDYALIYQARRPIFEKAVQAFTR